MLTYISFIFLLLPCLLPQALTPDLGHPSFILFSVFYADSLLIGPVCYFIQGYIIQCSRTNSPRTLTIFFPIKKLTRSLVDCKPDSYKDDCRIVRNASVEPFDHTKWNSIWRPCFAFAACIIYSRAPTNSPLMKISAPLPRKCICPSECK